MNRKSFKTMLMSSLALASLTGAGQVASASKLSNAKTIEYKATPERKAPNGKININPVTGGLDMRAPLPALGLSPKEYGLRHGNGGSKRSNRLRYSHNAKLKGRRR